MKPNNNPIEKQQNLINDIPTLESKILEYQENLRVLELEIENKRREESKLKTYLISYVKYYYLTGEVEIEASTEEEAIQIVEDNIGCYDGSMEWDYDKNFVESWGEVKE